MLIQVNLPYILWTTAYNTSFILLYLLLDMFFSGGCSGTTSAKRAPVNTGDEWGHPTSHYHADNGVLLLVTDNPPKLLDVVNKHGLVIFLIVSSLPISAPK